MLVHIMTADKNNNEKFAEISDNDEDIYTDNDPIEYYSSTSDDTKYVAHMDKRDVTPNKIKDLTAAEDQDTDESYYEEPLSSKDLAYIIDDALSSSELDQDYIPRSKKYRPLPEVTTPFRSLSPKKFKKARHKLCVPTAKHKHMKKTKKLLKNTDSHKNKHSDGRGGKIQELKGRDLPNHFAKFEWNPESYIFNEVKVHKDILKKCMLYIYCLDTPMTITYSIL